MFIKLCFCVFFATLVSARADLCKCDLADTHYKELGCKRVYEKPYDCCPKRYDCSKPIKLSGEPGKCYFNGKQYKLREYINSSLTEPNCKAAVRCVKGKTSDFVHADIDCFEFDRLPRGCFRQYAIDKCCSTRTVCPPYPKKKLATCKVGDRTVKEGELIYPKDQPYLRCICKKADYINIIQKNSATHMISNKLSCRKISCGNELKSLEMRKGDAPIYFEGRGYCPIGWLHKPDGKYENIGRKLEGEPDPSTCRFGNRIFDIGDTFKVEQAFASSPEQYCECVLPPLLTCTQKRNRPSNI